MTSFRPLGDCRPLFPPIQASDLDSVQNDLRRSLPKDYCEFLCQTNGLLFNEPLIVPLLDVDDEDEYPTLIRLYGISSRKSLDDIRFASAAYHFSSRVPDGYLPIGDDNSWNLLVMSLNSSEYGSIYYWMPGEPWPDVEEVASVLYLSKVSGSFSSMWSVLLPTLD
jgi:hypothetical protein